METLNFDNECKTDTKMIRMIKSNDHIFGMCNIVPRRSGLSVDIWSDHKGIQRQVLHGGTPRIKITKNNIFISVTISENPQIKVKSRKISKSDQKDLEEGIKYVARNYDLFLKHYMDDDRNLFDDEDLFNALRARGEYK